MRKSGFSGRYLEVSLEATFPDFRFAQTCADREIRRGYVVQVDMRAHRPIANPECPLGNLEGEYARIVTTVEAISML